MTQKYTEMKQEEELFPFRFGSETIKILATEETGEQVINILQEALQDDK